MRSRKFFQSHSFEGEFELFGFVGTNSDLLYGSAKFFGPGFDRVVARWEAAQVEAATHVQLRCLWLKPWRYPRAKEARSCALDQRAMGGVTTRLAVRSSAPR
jgi:hypothetical protein